MNHPSWTDEQILEAVRGGTGQRNLALRHFFTDKTLLKAVVSHVSNEGGNEQDGEDVFQDAAILFERNLREGRFEGRSSLRTYFIAIAKWRWVSNRRKHNGRVDLTDVPDGDSGETPELHLIEGERRGLIDRLLGQLGAKCEQMLRMYMLRHTMDEIAEAVGIPGGAEQARKDAYKCRMKMRSYLEQNPTLKDQLKPI